MLVLLVVGLVAFAMFRYVGDPVDTMLGQERTVEDIERLRENLGLNDPFFVQYWNFLGRAMQGDLGISYRQGRPVAEIIADACPRHWNSPRCRGVRAGLRDRGWVSSPRYAGRMGRQHDHDASLIGVVAADLPDRHPADLRLRGRAWLAAQFSGAARSWTSVVDHRLPDEIGADGADLPSITLGLYQMTLIMRLVRSEMLEVLRQDYIRFARARGLKDQGDQLPPCAEEHAGCR